MEVKRADRLRAELIKATMPGVLEELQTEIDQKLVRSKRALVRMDSEYSFMRSDILEVLVKHYTNHGWHAYAYYGDTILVETKEAQAAKAKEYVQERRRGIIAGALVILAILAVVGCMAYSEYLHKMTKHKETQSEQTVHND